MARKRSRPGTAEQTSGQRHRRSPARGPRGTGRSRPWGITRYPPAGRWTRRVARTENRGATPPVRSDWCVRRGASRVTTARAAATPHGLRRGRGHDHEHRDRTGSAVVAWANQRERCDQQQRPMKPPAHPAVVTRTRTRMPRQGADDRSHIDGTGRDRPDLAHSDPPFEINRDFAFWGRLRLLRRRRRISCHRHQGTRQWDGGVLGWEPHGGAAGE